MRYLSVLSVIFAAFFCLGAGPAYAKKNPYAGKRFQGETILKRGEVFSEQSVLVKPNLGEKADYKSYPQAEKIKLPPPKYKGLVLEEAIEKRRSLRIFSGEPLALAELSQLLYAAGGISGKRGNFELRTTPSHGRSYPIEIYILAKNVSGLSAGLYHYLPGEHSLEFIQAITPSIDFICVNPQDLTKAAAIFFLTAIPQRITSQFDTRGYRYIYLEAGHISQNLYLEATSLGLGSVAIGSFYDDEVDTLLGIDGKEEFAVYIQVVGRAAD